MVWRRTSGFKKKAEEEERTISQADECSISLTPSLAATWAPKGETPIIKGERRSKRLHIFAMITVKGELYYEVHKRNYTGKNIASMLEYISEWANKERFILIWDNASIHKNRDIQFYLNCHNKGCFHLAYQPPYTPESNATELLWAYLKKTISQNTAYKTLEELEERLIRALDSIGNNPKLIKSFFRKNTVNILTG